jgi:hypothetical protein
MTLTATRRWVFDTLTAAVGDVPVWLWLPGAVDGLPCYVVGRPDLDEDTTTRSVQRLTVPVYALGRTLRDDDAQAELDAMADTLIALLWRPMQDAAQSYRLTRGRATVLTIAAVEVPAYTMTVASSVQPC